MTDTTFSNSIQKFSLDSLDNYHYSIPAEIPIHVMLYCAFYTILHCLPLSHDNMLFVSWFETKNLSLKDWEAWQMTRWQTSPWWSTPPAPPPTTWRTSPSSSGKGGKLESKKVSTIQLRTREKYTLNDKLNSISILSRIIIWRLILTESTYL